MKTGRIMDQWGKEGTFDKWFWNPYRKKKNPFNIPDTKVKI